MTRDEAIAKCQPVSGLWSDHRLVSCLEALGILKLEEPKHQSANHKFKDALRHAGVDSLAILGVEHEMEKSGLKIVEK